MYKDTWYAKQFPIYTNVYDCGTNLIWDIIRSRYAKGEPERVFVANYINNTNYEPIKEPVFILDYIEEVVVVPLELINRCILCLRNSYNFEEYLDMVDKIITEYKIEVTTNFDWTIKNNNIIHEKYVV